MPLKSITVPCGEVILTKFSSLAAPEVVKMTTSGAASDENFIRMTTFSFQCLWLIYRASVEFDTVAAQTCQSRVADPSDRCRQPLVGCLVTRPRDHPVGVPPVKQRSAEIVSVVGTDFWPERSNGATVWWQEGTRHRCRERWVWGTR